MKILLSLMILFVPVSILAKQICIAPSGCSIEMDTGFCPKCIEVREEKPIITKKSPILNTAATKKNTNNQKKDSRWLSSLATHKRDTTPYNIKKPFVNDDGVEMCWFPELGWVSHLDSKGIPVNTGEYRDCHWRDRGNRTADAVKRGTIECGGYMNWVWTDEHHSKYRCNSKPKVRWTGCTWKCVVEPCDDDMLPEGCRWEGR